jgi:Icc-related predicted phosphoesterase
MKILAASDIHSDKLLVKRLADKADKENVDLVILCGDLTQSEQSTEGIIGPFVSKNKKVLLIPGNHESVATVDFLAELYGVKNIHGCPVRYENIGIFGCGGANMGLHQVSDEEIFKLLSKGFEKITYLDKKIMVTHVHPNNCLIEKFSSFVPGSKGVRKAIENLSPDVLLCGHVHEAEGIEDKIGKTKIFNVSKNGCILEF